MSYRIKMDGFEGPFDLLLYLVSRQKVDIGSVSVSQVADQYLAYIDRMHELDLDVASDFLLVASTLLEIKTSSLIAQNEDESEGEFDKLTPEQTHDILVARLIEYKKFKNAAAALGARREIQARMHARMAGPDEVFLGHMPDYLAGVSLDRLASLAAAAVARREEFVLESDHIAAKPVPVETYVRTIHRRISNRKHMMFSDLVPAGASLPVRVASFLALLELYKRSMVRIEQKELFADIAVDVIEKTKEERDSAR